MGNEIKPMEKIILACPKCDSTDVDICKADGGMVHPETTYFVCAECDYEWGWS